MIIDLRENEILQSSYKAYGSDILEELGWDVEKHRESLKERCEQ